MTDIPAPEVPEAPEPVNSPIKVTLIKVGENMGDHGQDVPVVLDCPDTTTIRELMEAAIPTTAFAWMPRKWEHRVELQFAKPLHDEGGIDHLLRKADI